MKISAVIPTRNRCESLRITLRSLVEQSRAPDEILIIDSSDDKTQLHELKSDFSAYPLRWFDAPASVCIQRNIGIANATGHWVFLCDDDIELQSDYLEKLALYVATKAECGAAAGRLFQLEDDKWVDQYPVKTFSELCWRFIFQLSVWGSTENIPANPIFRYLRDWINGYYRRRGNNLSLAGWPLITQWNTEVVKSRVYSLGANLVKKEWLVGAYDEVLDRHGIGDNYGVALKFPGCIHILNSTMAYHHRAANNRADRNVAYYRRVLALHYFLLKYRKGLPTLCFFVWSLIGNSIMSLFKRNFHLLRINMKVIGVVLCGRNPYYRGNLKKQQIVEPSY